jgi:acyl dehydratase
MISTLTRVHPCVDPSTAVEAFATDHAGMTRSLGPTDFAAPVDDRWFDDYAPGARYSYGYIDVDEEEIVRFAEEFDPQPIHVDRGFADAGPFGGIIGSGWHSAGLAMRLLAEHYLSRVASLASPGVDELRWRVPLRPGDRVHLRATVVEARPSRSKPDRGLVVTDVELVNQDGGVPISFRAMNLLAIRPDRRAPSGSA